LNDENFCRVEFSGTTDRRRGLDGSGKSTQIYLLKRWLEAEGIKVYFSEWNSSELVKSATSKGKKRELLTPTTFSLIHATDFADRYERHLLPLLRAGYVSCATVTFSPRSRATWCAAARPNGCVAFTISRPSPTSRFSSRRIWRCRSTAFLKAGPS